MPQTTTPDSLPYPVVGDNITPIEPWFANLATFVQAAITNVRNAMDKRVHGRATRTGSDQALPASATTISFNSLWGATGVSLSGGGFRVDSDGLYVITTSLVVTRAAPAAGTLRDFGIAVNGTQVSHYQGEPSNTGTTVYGRFSYIYPLSANDVVTFTSTGAQSGTLLISSNAEIARVSA